mmetsp:Transcript_56948/g.124519  ORF Transcript_56948/g.124519 Transcript_56948/m.124519 type:complete len:128 (-) Transcript_56948:1814-2197(-)
MGDSFGNTSPHGKYAPVSGGSPMHTVAASFPGSHVDYVPVPGKVGSYEKEKVPVWGVRMECLLLAGCLLLAAMLLFVYWMVVWIHASRVGHSDTSGDLTVSSSPFDCAAGASNWQNGWSDAKKRLVL